MMRLEGLGKINYPILLVFLAFLDNEDD